MLNVAVCITTEGVTAIASTGGCNTLWYCLARFKYVELGASLVIKFGDASRLIRVRLFAMLL